MGTSQRGYIKIIWPDYKKVPLSTVEIWYKDAVANGEIRECTCEITPQAMAVILHEAGLITLAKDWNHLEKRK